jgi:hypothetical protein
MQSLRAVLELRCCDPYAGHSADACAAVGRGGYVGNGGARIGMFTVGWSAPIKDPLTEVRLTPLWVLAAAKEQSAKPRKQAARNRDNDG